MRSRGSRGLAEALLLGLLCGPALLAATPDAATDRGLFDADGLRARHYRAPTPASVPGAVTLDTHALVELRTHGEPVLVDVQPLTLRPETREFGIAWLPSEPRYNIPGSVWLPNVGYAELDARMDEYFRTELARATGGDRGRALVFYCVADCWLSWNAVQRAARYGYRNLHWYRDGSDGWQEAGLPTELGEPVPLPPSRSEW